MATFSWTKYKVGKPSTMKNWTNIDCQPLTTVSHVAHLPTAIRIIEDVRLRADLIRDKSKLNTERISVVWLSPNDWTGAGGFRYGNIRFQYNWKTLIKGKHYYWVEKMAYGIEACRILISASDHSDKLVTYDPTLQNGPWWYDPSTRQHYWNGKYCLEIMHEGDIGLSNCTEVDFVTHHSIYCNENPGSCAARGLTSSKAAAVYVASITSRNYKNGAIGLIKKNGNKPIPGNALSAGTSRLLVICSNLKDKISKWGHINSGNPAAKPIARALLGELLKANKGDARYLAEMFRDIDNLMISVRDVISDTFGVSFDDID